MSELRRADGIPSTLAPRAFGPITMTDIVQYQGASGDMNPMHHDDHLARAAGYPAAFGIGMLNAGYLAAYCTDVFGPYSVRRFRTRFIALSFRGDVLTAMGKVLGTYEQDGELRMSIALRLENSEGALVVEGSAVFAVT